MNIHSTHLLTYSAARGRRILSILVCIAMIIAMIPFCTMKAEAATAHTCDLAFGSVSITPYTPGTPGTLTYNPASGSAATSETLAEGDTVTIRQTGYETTSTVNTITVSGSGTANMTLDGVNISASACAFSISSSSTVNLTVANSNTMVSSGGYAGLQVPSGTTFTIAEISSGSLTASAGTTASSIIAGAGIGGGNGSECGTIKIYGGTVTATGGSSNIYGGGAGIGGAGGIIGSYAGKSGGTIEIKNADVKAYGGIGGKYSGGGAGIGGGGGSCNYEGSKLIGGGNGGDGGTITIDSGTVEATGGQCGYANDSSGTGLGGAGAGIGGGGATGYTFTSDGSFVSYKGGSGGSITISGGKVTAKGNHAIKFGGSGAGIGGGGAYVQSGIGGDGGIILISGGNISATGGAGGAGTYKFYGGAGAGIGGGGAGYYDSTGGVGGTITIEGGYVAATGGSSDDKIGRGTGIGGGTGNYNSGTGSGGAAANLKISGGTVIANCGPKTGYASSVQYVAPTGIGAGYSGTADGTCTIDGGSVYASSMESAVINSKNENLYCNTITVSGISAITDVSYTVDSGTNSVSCSTDTFGKLYLWLPESSSAALNITKADTSYHTYYKADCAVTTTASINMFIAKERVTVSAISVNSDYDGSSKTGYAATVTRASGTDITASVASSLKVAYYSGNAVDASKLLTSAPSGAGEYTAVITLESANYYADSVTVCFTIKPDGLALTSDAPHLAVEAGQALAKTYSLDLSELTFNQNNTGTVNYALGTATDSSSILSTAPSLSGSAVTVTVNANIAEGLTATVPIIISTANYSAISTTLTISTVNKTTLALSGVSISDKEYDGTAVSPTGTLVFTDAGNNSVEISNPVYMYTGTGGTTYSSKIAPTDAGSYTLTISVPSSNSTYIGSTALNFTISRKALTVTGLSAADKEYDGTSAVTVSGTAALSGAVSGDNITLAGSPTFSFVDSAIQSNKVISMSGQYSISGTDSANYTLTQPSLTASITKRQITITPNSNLSKVYGDTDPVIGYTYTGSLLGTDTLSGNLSYDGSGAGMHTITLGSVAVAGNSDYYNLGIANVKFNIEQKPLTIVGAVVSSKSYDGTTFAGVAALSLSGIVSSDDVTASGTASFSSADTGEKTSVDLTDIALSGNSSGNYTVSNIASNITLTSAAHINKVTPAVILTAVNTSASENGNKAGDTIVLTATVTGISGYPPTGTVTFAAGGTSKTVNVLSDGTATFTWIASAGSFNLTAEYSGNTNYNTASGTINAFDVTKLSQNTLFVTNTPDTLYYGDLVELLYAGGSGNGDISWSFSNNEVLTLDASGRYKANNVGKVTVTVTKAADDTYNQASATFIIDVLQGTLSIDSPQAGSITVGSKLSCSALTGGAATSSANGETVAGVFSWDNPDQTVTQSGKYSVIFTPQNANYKSATLMVEVTVTKKSVTGISLDKKTLSLQVGSLVGTLTATVAPSDATNTNVTWSSGNEKVATVSNGVVTPVSAGTATITVTTEDGGYTTTCAVTVSSASSGGSSGGSGGSSGGGSIGTTTPPHASISGTGTSQNTLSVTVDSRAGSASVDLGTLNNIFTVGSITPVVTIPPVSGVDSYTAGIPTASLTTAQGSHSLTISTDAGNITIPDNMLTGVSGINGKQAQITIGEGDKAGLSEGVKTAIGNRPLVQLTLSVDGAKKEWNNPNAPVTISVPYTPTAEELKNPESIVIWYLDGSGNAVCVPNGHYDSAMGKVTFATTHFSQYAVSFQKVTFRDVASNKWYDKAVDFVAARGITTGTGNDSFSPAKNLTRGEFIVMLMKAYGIAPATNSSENFSDAGDSYYTGYLAAAKKTGISNGIGGNLFAPKKQITRQEMFTLLYNSLKVIGELPADKINSTLASYKDADKISSWAEDAMVHFVGTGTISGSNDMLAPTDFTTRAQMAQVLYKLMTK